MSRSRIAVAAVTLLTAALPATAAAQQPPTITASGVAQVKPEPANRKNNGSIRKAVDEARAKALPQAIANARAHAGELAAAANVTLGSLLSISDTPQAGFPYFNLYGQDGTFGPGRYCGDVRRSRTVVRDGVRRRVPAKGTRRVCRVPSQVYANVALTFATTG